MANVRWCGIKKDTGGVGNMFKQIKQIATQYTELRRFENNKQPRKVQSQMVEHITCKHHEMQW
jgi:hypothetical protein